MLKNVILLFPDTGVAHSCASLLRDNGEAVFALAFGYGGEGGLLLVKLPVAGSAVTMMLKRESTVPRFLSGITGALRYFIIIFDVNISINLLPYWGNTKHLIMTKSRYTVWLVQIKIITLDS